MNRKKTTKSVRLTARSEVAVRRPLVAGSAAVVAVEGAAAGSISEDTMGPFFPAGPPVRLMGPGLAVSTHR